ncbi:MAG TPA: NUDIX domain-containing protein [Candidatus Limnocylindrales bacterium]|jgi:8-oxo-dGTP pyrophosphatase MutT (NUDIX family)
MSPIRPDLIECWVFRLPDPAPDDRAGVHTGAVEPEFLLIRRAPGRIFPGLWQCVTGGPEPAERIPQVALREVAEETGLGTDDIEGFYDLDMVSSFYDEGPDAIVSGAIFAMRVQVAAEPRLSDEHDAFRWATAADARALVVWPSYGECLDRIRRYLLDPVAARWFELDLDGRRLLR